MFQLEHLFKGQVDLHGTVTANASSTKAVGLQETKEQMKPNDQEPASTNLVISLDKKVEPNFINLTGKKPSFYKQPHDATFCTLVTVIGCLVKCATEGYIDGNNDVKTLNEV